MTRETTITQFPSAKPTSPDQISKQPSPAAGNPDSTNPGSTNPGPSNPGSTTLVATPQRELEHLDRKQLKKLQSALNGAQAGALARSENRVRAHRNLPAERQRVPHRRMTDTLLRRVKDSAIPPTPHYNQRQPRFTRLTTIWLTKLLPLRLLLLRRRSRALRPSSRFRLILARNLAQLNATCRRQRS